MLRNAVSRIAAHVADHHATPARDLDVHIVDPGCGTGNEPQLWQCGDQLRRQADLVRDQHFGIARVLQHPFRRRVQVVAPRAPADVGCGEAHRGQKSAAVEKDYAHPASPLAGRTTRPAVNAVAARPVTRGTRRQPCAPRSLR